MTMTENNWAKGALTEGVSLVNISLEIIRKEAENCDSLTVRLSIQNHTKPIFIP